MMTPLAAAVMTAIVASYGEEAVAAFGVGSRLESIACIVILALSSTLPPFISQNLGAGKPERIAEACRLSIRFVLIWQLLIYVLMAMTAPIISLMFTRDETVANIIQTFIWILPLSYGMQGVIILCNRIAGGFQFLHINGGAMLCKLGVVKAGREEGVNLGHGAVIAQWTGPGKQPEAIVCQMGRML